MYKVLHVWLSFKHFNNSTRQMASQMRILSLQLQWGGVIFFLKFSIQCCLICDLVSDFQTNVAMLAGIPASTLAPFQRVLHAATRTVLDLKPHDPCEWLQLFKSWTGLWLSVIERIQNKFLLIHKSLLGHTPDNINIRGLLTSVANIPNPEVTTRFIVWQPRHAADRRIRRRIGDRTFSVAAPPAWNRLPTELKLLRPTDSWPENISVWCCLRAPAGYGLTVMHPLS